MARATSAAAGASRIGYVFTPAELRGHGYAAACVAALSKHVRDVLGVACLLYTELANPVPTGSTVGSGIVPSPKC